MKRFQKILCLVIALCMALGSVSFAETADTAAPSEPYTAYADAKGRVTLIDGAYVDTPINSFDDATGVIAAVLPQLGGDENTQLDPWREVNDAFGNHFFIFQQMFNGTTVLGGAVKVITDENGAMIGLTSSIEDNPAGPAVSEGITAAEAEQIVQSSAMEAQRKPLTVLDGMTSRMILPVLVKDLRMESEDVEGSRYVWVVYTDNPDSSVSTVDLPYLAHYVTLSGEYLYSLPTIAPGDEAGTSGFDAGYVFEFMESVNYTGCVDLSTGGEQVISVDVMRDKRTGMYYLGNLERRIVVGDCWEFLYGGNRVVLESSPDNREWDQTGLLTLYNYCRAYDYYKEIGWVGGDGLGTPILVLNNFCNDTHQPINNACYVGGFLGWQIFIASRANDFSQCLDVLAHEYTHCVTGSVMTYNAYQNDYGAINEAISDIQGKTCQLLMENSENPSWVLGDCSVVHIRSMNDPHLHQQPAFTWDTYYVPNAVAPTVMNDRGGVHVNSSLLNRLAYMLYENGGMTLEEGRAFWFTVDCTMVPGTDYPQLARILPFALRAAGLEKYETALQQALDATRLGVTDIPEVFDQDRALVTLELPDNEIFNDGEWVLQAFIVDIDLVFSRLADLFAQTASGDYSDLPAFLQEALTATPEPEATPAPTAEPAQEQGFLEALMEILLSTEAPAEIPAEIPEDEAPEGNLEAEIGAWAADFLDGASQFTYTNAGQDGRTLRMVSIPGYAVPLLIHAKYNSSTNDMDESKMLVYIGGQWLDFNSLLDVNTENPNAELPPEIQAILDRVLEPLFNPDVTDKLGGMLSALLFRIKGGVQNTLPANGLETMVPRVLEPMTQPGEAQESLPEPKKSRPLAEEPAA